MERTLIVCDDCGKPAVERVGLRINGKAYSLDQCSNHLDALMSKAHPAKRGRRPKLGAAPG